VIVAKPETFKIEQFAGLTTSPAMGHSPMRFRELQNLDPGRVPGSLTVAYAPRMVSGAALSDIARVMTLDEAADSTPAVLIEYWNGQLDLLTSIEPAASAGLFSPRATWAYDRPAARFWRGKFAVIVGETASGDPYPVFATPTGWQTADQTDTGDNDIGATATVDSAYDVPAGTYYLYATPLAKLEAGTDTWYVKCAESSPMSGSLELSGAGRIQYTFTPANGIDALQIALYDAASESYFDVGVVVTSGSIEVMPTQTAVYPDPEPHDWHSLVAGSAVAYRNERTWVAYNPNYDYTLWNSLQRRLGLPPATATGSNVVLYSEVGRPWAFSPDNTIVADVDGQVTALGVLGDALIIFGPYGAARLTGNGPEDFFVQRLEQVSPGTWWQDSVHAFGGGLLYLGPDGVYRLTGDGQVQRVSDPLKDVFDDLTFAPSQSIRTTVDRKRGLYILASTGQLGGGQRAFAMDLKSGEWFEMPAAGDGIATIFGDLSPWAVSVGEAIYAFDGDTSTEATLATDQLDLGAPDVIKQFHEFRVPVENPTDEVAIVRLEAVRRDGTTIPFSSRTIEAGATAELVWKLPGHRLVGRSIAFRMTIEAKPGFLVVPPIEVVWLPRRTQ
jgi:hypothetical protein